MNPKLAAGPFALMLCLITIDARAQVESKVVEPPSACVDEVGEVQWSYQVLHSFRNTKSGPLRIQIGTSPFENFYLFTSTTTVDPAAAAYTENLDSLSTPASRTRTVNPNESVAWTTTATISIAGPSGVPAGLPKPGVYYLLPIPDVRIIGENSPQPKRPGIDQLIPLRIPKPSGKLPKCK